MDFDDKVASLKVVGSCNWTLFNEPNYQGPQQTFVEGDYKHWNDIKDVLYKAKSACLLHDGKCLPGNLKQEKMEISIGIIVINLHDPAFICSGVVCLLFLVSVTACLFYCFCTNRNIPGEQSGTPGLYLFPDKLSNNLPGQKPRRLSQRRLLSLRSTSARSEDAMGMGSLRGMK